MDSERWFTTVASQPYLPPISVARRQDLCPTIWRVSTLQHPLEDSVRVAFAAGCAQGMFIIDPRKKDDPGFRVEPEK